MNTPEERPCEAKREEERDETSASSDDDSTRQDPTRQALIEIAELQDELKFWYKKASTEMLKVDDKYNKIQKPYYDKRAVAIEKIPNFWLKAIMNHPEISKLVDENEKECLHFLRRVQVEDFENLLDGFRIMFIFAENPFFENLELVKEFQMRPKWERKSTSTTIKWKENMDLSQKRVWVSNSRKKRRLEQRTFFSWFSDNKNYKKLSDDEIAEAIRAELWRNALDYYMDYSDDEAALTKDDRDSEDDVEKKDDVNDEENAHETSEEDDSVSSREDEEEESSLGSDDDSLASGMKPLRDIVDCQKELDELDEKANEEILQLENRYNKLLKLYYDKRAVITEKIPNFWMNSIVNHPQISMLVSVSVDDEDCLCFLKNLEVEEFVEGGFRIMFIFNKNPFFENLELVKEFKLRSNMELKSTSRTIKWKENMNFSQKQMQIIEARKKRGLLELRTFFSWYSDDKDPEADDIADVFRYGIWRNPLKYYVSPDLEDCDRSDNEESMDEDDYDSDDGIMDEEEDHGSSNGEDREGDDGVSKRKRRKRMIGTGEGEDH